MRRLWTEDRVEFEGEFYRTHGASVYDRPEQPVPVYVAAGGPLVARYAGRSGDGFICTSGKGRELYEDKLLPAVDEGLEKSGRTRDDIDRMIEIKLSYDRDPDAGAAQRALLGAAVAERGAEARRDDPIEMERLADELSDEQIAKRWIVTSDPAEAVEDGPAVRRLGLQPHRLPRARATTRRASSSSSRPTCCPGCVSSAESL